MQSVGATWQTLGTAAAVSAAAAGGGGVTASERDATPKSTRVRLTRWPGRARTRHGESMLPQPVSSLT